MRTCKVEGCDKKVIAKDMCTCHYNQIRKFGKIIDYSKIPKITRLCDVEGCENKHFSGGYCSKHYSHIRKYGKIIKRTFRDKNEIIIKSNYAIIISLGLQNQITAKSKIDLEDVERVSKEHWGLNGTGYLWSSRLNMSLGNFILDCKTLVDHINRDKLDNRKQNLRKASVSLNRFNTVVPSGISGHRGVYPKNYKNLKSNNEWRAVCSLNGKRNEIGIFNRIEDAIEARRKFEIEQYGEEHPKC